MQPLTQQVPGRLDLGCLASAGGIGAGDFPWEVIYASSAGVWWANVEGLKGDAVYPGLVGSWAEGGGGSALGPPVVGIVPLSCFAMFFLEGCLTAGLVHLWAPALRPDMVCWLSLMDKFAFVVLLECAVAIYTGWSWHGNMFNCSSSILSVSQVSVFSITTRVKYNGSGNDRLETLVPPEKDVHACIACASSK